MRVTTLVISLCALQYVTANYETYAAESFRNNLGINDIIDNRLISSNSTEFTENLNGTTVRANKTHYKYEGHSKSHKGETIVKTIVIRKRPDGDIIVEEEDTIYQPLDPYQTVDIASIASPTVTVSNNVNSASAAPEPGVEELTVPTVFTNRASSIGGVPNTIIQEQKISTQGGGIQQNVPLYNSQIASPGITTVIQRGPIASGVTTTTTTSRETSFVENGNTQFVSDIGAGFGTGAAAATDSAALAKAGQGMSAGYPGQVSGSNVVAAAAADAANIAGFGSGYIQGGRPIRPYGPYSYGQYTPGFIQGPYSGAAANLNPAYQYNQIYGPFSQSYNPGFRTYYEPLIGPDSGTSKTAAATAKSTDTVNNSPGPETTTTTTTTSLSIKAPYVSETDKVSMTAAKASAPGQPVQEIGEGTQEINSGLSTSAAAATHNPGFGYYYPPLPIGGFTYPYGPYSPRFGQNPYSGAAANMGPYQYSQIYGPYGQSFYPGYNRYYESLINPGSTTIATAADTAARNFPNIGVYLPGGEPALQAPYQFSEINNPFGQFYRSNFDRNYDLHIASGLGDSTEVEGTGFGHAGAGTSLKTLPASEGPGTRIMETDDSSHASAAAETRGTSSGASTDAAAERSDSELLRSDTGVNTLPVSGRPGTTIIGAANANAAAKAGGFSSGARITAAGGGTDSELLRSRANAAAVAAVAAGGLVSGFPGQGAGVNILPRSGGPGTGIIGTEISSHATAAAEAGETSNGASTEAVAGGTDSDLLRSRANEAAEAAVTAGVVSGLLVPGAGVNILSTSGGPSTGIIGTEISSHATAAAEAGETSNGASTEAVAGGTDSDLLRSRANEAAEAAVTAGVVSELLVPGAGVNILPTLGGPGTEIIGNDVSSHATAAAEADGTSYWASTGAVSGELESEILRSRANAAAEAAVTAGVVSGLHVPEASVKILPTSGGPGTGIIGTDVSSHATAAAEADGSSSGASNTAAAGRTSFGASIAASAGENDSEILRSRANAAAEAAVTAGVVSGLHVPEASVKILPTSGGPGTGIIGTDVSSHATAAAEADGSSSGASNTAATGRTSFGASIAASAGENDSEILRSRANAAAEAAVTAGVVSGLHVPEASVKILPTSGGSGTGIIGTDVSSHATAAAEADGSSSGASNTAAAGRTSFGASIAASAGENDSEILRSRANAAAEAAVTAGVVSGLHVPEASVKILPTSGGPGTGIIGTDVSSHATAAAEADGSSSGASNTAAAGRTSFGASIAASAGENDSEILRSRANAAAEAAVTAGVVSGLHVPEASVKILPTSGGSGTGIIGTDVSSHATAAAEADGSSSGASNTAAAGRTSFGASIAASAGENDSEILRSRANAAAEAAVTAGVVSGLHVPEASVKILPTSGGSGTGIIGTDVSSHATAAAGAGGTSSGASNAAAARRTSFGASIAASAGENDSEILRSRANAAAEAAVTAGVVSGLHVPEASVKILPTSGGSGTGIIGTDVSSHATAAAEADGTSYWASTGAVSGELESEILRSRANAAAEAAVTAGVVSGLLVPEASVKILSTSGGPSTGIIGTDVSSHATAAAEADGSSSGASNTAATGRTSFRASIAASAGENDSEILRSRANAAAEAAVTAGVVSGLHVPEASVKILPTSGGSGTGIIGTDVSSHATAAAEADGSSSGASNTAAAGRTSFGASIAASAGENDSEILRSRANAAAEAAVTAGVVSGLHVPEASVKILPTSGGPGTGIIGTDVSSHATAAAEADGSSSGASNTAAAGRTSFGASIAASAGENDSEILRSRANAAAEAAVTAGVVSGLHVPEASVKILPTSGGSGTGIIGTDVSSHATAAAEADGSSSGASNTAAAGRTSFGASIAASAGENDSEILRSRANAAAEAAVTAGVVSGLHVPEASVKILPTSGGSGTGIIGTDVSSHATAAAGAGGTSSGASNAAAARRTSFGASIAASAGENDSEILRSRANAAAEAAVTAGVVSGLHVPEASVKILPTSGGSGTGIIGTDVSSHATAAAEADGTSYWASTGAVSGELESEILRSRANAAAEAAVTAGVVSGLLVPEASVKILSTSGGPSTGIIGTDVSSHATAAAEADGSSSGASNTAATGRTSFGASIAASAGENDSEILRSRANAAAEAAVTAGVVSGLHVPEASVKILPTSGGSGTAIIGTDVSSHATAAAEADGSSSGASNTAAAGRTSFGASIAASAGENDSEILRSRANAAAEAAVTAGVVSGLHVPEASVKILPTSGGPGTGIIGTDVSSHATAAAEADGSSSGASNTAAAGRTSFGASIAASAGENDSEILRSRANAAAEAAVTAGVVSGLHVPEASVKILPTSGGSGTGIIGTDVSSHATAAAEADGSSSGASNTAAAGRTSFGASIAASAGENDSEILRSRANAAAEAAVTAGVVSGLHVPEASVKILPTSGGSGTGIIGTDVSSHATAAAEADGTSYWASTGAVSGELESEILRSRANAAAEAAVTAGVVSGLLVPEASVKILSTSGGPSTGIIGTDVSSHATAAAEADGSSSGASNTAATGRTSFGASIAASAGENDSEILRSRANAAAEAAVTAGVVSGLHVPEASVKILPTSGGSGTGIIGTDVSSHATAAAEADGSSSGASNTAAAGRTSFGASIAASAGENDSEILRSRANAAAEAAVTAGVVSGLHVPEASVKILPTSGGSGTGIIGTDVSSHATAAAGAGGTSSGASNAAAARRTSFGASIAASAGENDSEILRSRANAAAEAAVTAGVVSGLHVPEASVKILPTSGGPGTGIIGTDVSSHATAAAEADGSSSGASNTAAAGRTSFGASIAASAGENDSEILRSRANAAAEAAVTAGVVSGLHVPEASVKILPTSGGSGTGIIGTDVSSHATAAAEADGSSSGASNTAAAGRTSFGASIAASAGENDSEILRSRANAAAEAAVTAGVVSGLLVPGAAVNILQTLGAPGTGIIGTDVSSHATAAAEAGGTSYGASTEAVAGGTDSEILRLDSGVNTLPVSGGLGTKLIGPGVDLSADAVATRSPESVLTGEVSIASPGLQQPYRQTVVLPSFNQPYISEPINLYGPDSNAPAAVSEVDNVITNVQENVQVTEGIQTDITTSAATTTGFSGGSGLVAPQPGLVIIEEDTSISGAPLIGAIPGRIAPQFPAIRGRLLCRLLRKQLPVYIHESGVACANCY